MVLIEALLTFQTDCPKYVEDRGNAGTQYPIDQNQLAFSNSRLSKFKGKSSSFLKIDENLALFWSHNGRNTTRKKVNRNIGKARFIQF